MIDKFLIDEKGYLSANPEYVAKGPETLGIIRAITSYNSDLPYNKAKLLGSIAIANGALDLNKGDADYNSKLEATMASFSYEHLVAACFPYYDVDQNGRDKREFHKAGHFKESQTLIIAGKAALQEERAQHAMIGAALAAASAVIAAATPDARPAVVHSIKVEAMKFRALAISNTFIESNPKNQQAELRKRVAALATKRVESGVSDSFETTKAEIVVMREQLKDSAKVVVEECKANHAACGIEYLTNLATYKLTTLSPEFASLGPDARDAAIKAEMVVLARIELGSAIHDSIYASDGKAIPIVLKQLEKVLDVNEGILTWKDSAKTDPNYAALYDLLERRGLAGPYTDPASGPGPNEALSDILAAVILTESAVSQAVQAPIHSMILNTQPFTSNAFQEIYENGVRRCAEGIQDEAILALVQPRMQEFREKTARLKVVKESLPKLDREDRELQKFFAVHEDRKAISRAIKQAKLSVVAAESEDILEKFAARKTEIMTRLANDLDTPDVKQKLKKEADDLSFYIDKQQSFEARKTEIELQLVTASEGDQRVKLTTELAGLLPQITKAINDKARLTDINEQLNDLNSGLSHEDKDNLAKEAAALTPPRTLNDFLKIASQQRTKGNALPPFNDAKAVCNGMAARIENIVYPHVVEANKQRREQLAAKEAFIRGCLAKSKIDLATKDLITRNFGLIKDSIVAGLDFTNLADVAAFAYDIDFLAKEKAFLEEKYPNLRCDRYGDAIENGVDGFEFVASLQKANDGFYQFYLLSGLNSGAVALYHHSNDPAIDNLTPAEAGEKNARGAENLKAALLLNKLLYTTGALLTAEMQVGYAVEKPIIKDFAIGSVGDLTSKLATLVGVAGPQTSEQRMLTKVLADNRNVPALSDAVAKAKHFQSKMATLPPEDKILYRVFNELVNCNEQVHGKDFPTKRSFSHAFAAAEVLVKAGKGNVEKMAVVVTNSINSNSLATDGPALLKKGMEVLGEAMEVVSGVVEDVAITKRLILAERINVAVMVAPIAPERRVSRSLIRGAGLKESFPLARLTFGEEVAAAKVGTDAVRDGPASRGVALLTNDIVTTAPSILDSLDLAAQGKGMLLHQRADIPVRLR